MKLFESNTNEFRLWLLSLSVLQADSKGGLIFRL